MSSASLGASERASKPAATPELEAAAASEGTRGTVVIVPGYADHRGRYGHVVAHLNQHGYDVFVGDLRGHGQSGGPRGFIRRFDEYLEDVSAFIEQAMPRANAPPGPRRRRPILLGHSMGGLVALHYALARPDAVRAVAVTSPFFGVKIDVPAWKAKLGEVASLLWPGLKLPSGISPADITHDETFSRGYATDPLVFKTATARWFTEMLSAHEGIKRCAGELRVPTLMLVAGDDRIVDASMCQVVYDKLGASDKTLNVYPGLFHEVFNEREPDRQRVLADLTNWLNEH